jgi:hypothetical protein
MNIDIYLRIYAVDTDTYLYLFEYMYVCIHIYTYIYTCRNKHIYMYILYREVWHLSMWHVHLQSYYRLLQSGLNLVRLKDWAKSSYNSRTLPCSVHITQPFIRPLLIPLYELNSLRLSDWMKNLCSETVF